MANRLSRASEALAVVPASAGHVAEQDPIAVEATAVASGARVPAFTLAPGSRCVVHAYARRNTWLSRLEIEQEALIATFASRGRCTESGEAYRVAVALCRFVAEQRSAVTLSKHIGNAGSRERANWERAASARRAPLAVQLDDGSEIEHPEVASIAADAWEPIEEQLDRARALAVAVAVLEVRSEAARAVVLEGEKPAEVAERLGLSRAEVYYQADQARKALRAELAPMVEERK